MNDYVCPVCGFPGLHEPAADPDGGGSYEICWSCGFQFGVTDDDQGFTYEQWRKQWVERGMPWDSMTLRAAPAGWNPAAQLAELLA